MVDNRIDLLGLKHTMSNLNLYSTLDIQLARVAYEAYAATSDPEPPFPLLPETQQVAWLRVADAVKGELIKLRELK